jgi:hypothetical protein
VKFGVFPLELVVSTGCLPGQLEDRVLPSPGYTVLGISGDLPESRGAVLLLEHLSPLTPGYEKLPEDRAIGEVQARLESTNRRQRSLSGNRG